MTLLFETRELATMRRTPGPLLELKPLEWDTAFFGVRMGTIVRREAARGVAAATEAGALTHGMQELLREARAEGYAHLIFRTSSATFASIWAAETAGLRLVDVGVDSSIDLAGGVPARLADASALRPARADDLPALRELAAEAFTLSRFSSDPFFAAEQVREFHREWTTNLFKGLAQAVLVCERGDTIAGFVSCARTGDEGRIPLIAASSGFRGQGIGSSLIGAALRWFADAGCRVAHVKTQAHNVAALALYHRSGFNVSKTELTFSITVSSAANSQGDQ
jgi:dTDP-4-amino-4,6-dideoxy-D-galactose acyltransferase